MSRFVTLVLLLSCLQLFCGASSPHNVLLLMVDDLRPQIAAYSDFLSFMHTPNLDRLAQDGGVLFKSAHSQQSICSPTRNSMLSGRHVAVTKVWNFFENFRNGTAEGESWVALPQFFKNHGYWTTGVGKIYHPNHPPKYDYPLSWSEPWAGDYGKCVCENDEGPHATCEGVTNTTCGDDEILSVGTQQIKSAIQRRETTGQPFFLGIGFHKPHLPFHWSPPNLVDMYDDMPEPPTDVLEVPEDSPYVAWHSCLSAQNGPNNSNWGEFVDIPNNMTYTQPMNKASRDRLRRGYAASVSYTDANIGKILDALEPVRNDTVVLMVGDHGWSLAEQNSWCKMLLWENSLRVPLIISQPGTRGQAPKVVDAPVEMLDIYRTLADLSGLGNSTLQDSVGGVSLLPLIEDPTATPSRPYATSMFPRCYHNLNVSSRLPAYDRTDCQDIAREDFDFMGYTIRTADYRYSEWRPWIGDTLSVDWNLPAPDVELYDHRNDTAADPFATEMVNVAHQPAYAEQVAKLSTLLRTAFEKL